MKKNYIQRYIFIKCMLCIIFHINFLKKINLKYFQLIDKNFLILKIFKFINGFFIR